MKRMLALSCCLVLLLSLIACGEQGAETDAPQNYSNDGLTFDHPGNWEVTEDSLQESVRYVMVETPGDAILTIHLFQADEAPELSDFARIFANATQEEVEMGTINPSTFSAVENANGYEAMSEQFSITLLGQDVPHTRIYRRRAFGDKVCFIMGQVADEDKTKVTPGFEQVIASLRYGGE